MLMGAPAMFAPIPSVSSPVSRGSSCHTAGRKRRSRFIDDAPTLAATRPSRCSCMHTHVNFEHDCLRLAGACCGLHRMALSTRQARRRRTAQAPPTRLKGPPTHTQHMAAQTVQRRLAPQRRLQQSPRPRPRRLRCGKAAWCQQTAQPREDSTMTTAWCPCRSIRQLTAWRGSLGRRRAGARRP